MKLGLLGGTFNPVHLAHLRIAEEAREAAALDKVLFVPAADPPHKVLDGDIPFADRHEMVRLAIACNEAFGITDIEARRDAKSYTVDTLTLLRNERPDDELFFIIGSDSFLEMGLWHRYTEIFHLASIVVVERPGSEITDPMEQLPQDARGQFRQHSPLLLIHSSNSSVIFVKGGKMDISSSRLREILLEGRSVRYLMPPDVEEYIAQKGLYRK